MNQILILTPIQCQRYLKYEDKSLKVKKDKPPYRHLRDKHYKSLMADEKHINNSEKENYQSDGEW